MILYYYYIEPYEIANFIGQTMCITAISYGSI